MNRTQIIHIDDHDEIRCLYSSRPGGYPVIEIEGPEIGTSMVWIFSTLDSLRRLRDAISAYLAEHGDHIDDGPVDAVDIMSEPEPARPPVAEAVLDHDDLLSSAMAAGGVD